MIRGIRFCHHTYTIIKKSNGVNGKPLPNMDIFYLNDNNHK